MFALYNQELSRDPVAPNCQTLRSMVRQHFDQHDMDTKFQSRKSKKNGDSSIGQESKRVKRPAQKEKWENIFNGRQMYSVQEEVLLVLTMELILVNDHNHPLLHQERHRRLTGENPANNGNLKGESLSGLKGRKPSGNFFGGTFTEPSCDFWHPPVCLIHKLESGW